MWGEEAVTTEAEIGVTLPRLSLLVFTGWWLSGEHLPGRCKGPEFCLLHQLRTTKPHSSDLSQLQRNLGWFLRSTDLGLIGAPHAGSRHCYWCVIPQGPQVHALLEAHGGVHTARSPHSLASWLGRVQGGVLCGLRPGAPLSGGPRPWSWALSQVGRAPGPPATTPTSGCRLTGRLFPGAPQQLHAGLLWEWPATPTSRQRHPGGRCDTVRAADRARGQQNSQMWDLLGSHNIRARGPLSNRQINRMLLRTLCFLNLYLYF